MSRVPKKLGANSAKCSIASSGHFTTAGKSIAARPLVGARTREVTVLSDVMIVAEEEDNYVPRCSWHEARAVLSTAVGH